MLTYILVGAVFLAALVFMVVFVLDEAYTLPGRIFGLLIPAPLVAALCGALMFGAMCIGTFFLPTHELDPYTDDLQAINAGSGIKGSFFLGTGVIADEQRYTYYAKNDDGSFYMGSVSADSTTIVETDDEEPRIEAYPVRAPSWFMPEWFDYDTRFVIYIPVGSIKPMVNMDLPE